MFTIRYATEDDASFWYTLDAHIRKSEFLLKVRDKRGYIICDNDTSIGVLRYNLFWDTIPFLTLLFIREEYQVQGYGRQAMLHWEREMRAQGHSMTMTSTQADEQAQHFYRKLGYVDRGSLFLDQTPCEQPAELIMIKRL